MVTFIGSLTGTLAQEEGRGRELPKRRQRYDSDVIPKDGFKIRSLGCVHLKFWSLPRARTVLA